VRRHSSKRRSTSWLASPDVGDAIQRSQRASSTNVRRRTIVGVMGPGAGASRKDLEHARRLGALLAQEGWIVLCGGRSVG
jgi:predicted Rossmann-fold nucleotide-binding protein